MTILSVQFNNIGQAGDAPQFLYLATNDTIATVTSPGYLNHLLSEGIPISDKQVAVISTKTSPHAKASFTDLYTLTFVGSEIVVTPMGAGFAFNPATSYDGISNPAITGNWLHLGGFNVQAGTGNVILQSDTGTISLLAPNAGQFANVHADNVVLTGNTNLIANGSTFLFQSSGNTTIQPGGQLTLDSSQVRLPSIPNVSSANLIFYDNVTKQISYFSASGLANAWETTGNAGVIGGQLGTTDANGWAMTSNSTQFFTVDPSQNVTFNVGTYTLTAVNNTLLNSTTGSIQLSALTSGQGVSLSALNSNIGVTSGGIGMGVSLGAGISIDAATGNFSSGTGNPGSTYLSGSQNGMATVEGGTGLSLLSASGTAALQGTAVLVGTTNATSITIGQNSPGVTTQIHAQSLFVNSSGNAEFDSPLTQIGAVLATTLNLGNVGNSTVTTVQGGSFTANPATIAFPNIPNASTANVLFFDSVTGNVSWSNAANSAWDIAGTNSGAGLLFGTNSANGWGYQANSVSFATVSSSGNTTWTGGGQFNGTFGVNSATAITITTADVLNLTGTNAIIQSSSSLIELDSSDSITINPANSFFLNSGGTVNLNSFTTFAILAGTNLSLSTLAGNLTTSIVGSVTLGSSGSQTFNGSSFVVSPSNIQFTNLPNVNNSSVVLFNTGTKEISYGSAPPSFTWLTVSSPTTLATATGYIANSVGLLTFTLPATANVGDEFEIVGKGAGGWTITQNGGQNIQVGATSSTVGGGGSVSSTNQFDVIRLVCTTLNTTFTAQFLVGNLSVV